MVHIGKDTAHAHREARVKEYGKYRATEPIYIDGVLAFGKGFAVPISHVERFPELLEEDAVEEIGPDGEPVTAGSGSSEPTVAMPAPDAKRADWMAYAKTRGATAAELGSVKDGGLSRNGLRDKYGTEPEPDKPQGEPEQ